jgi:glucosamine-phosphate N-acetyltransferase
VSHVVAPERLAHAPAQDGDDGPLLAVGTLLLERKLARGLGLCGHVGAHARCHRCPRAPGRSGPGGVKLTRFPEDFVVHESVRGTGVGRILLEALVDLGRVAGCYKVILDSPLEAVGFFEKCYLFQNDVASA